LGKIGKLYKKEFRKLKSVNYGFTEKAINDCLFFSEETETSDQSVTESFPEENVPDEKPDQMDDTHLNQTEEKPDMDSAEENKDTV
jgi:hypothetical protein